MERKSKIGDLDCQIDKLSSRQKKPYRSQGFEES